MLGLYLNAQLLSDTDPIRVFENVAIGIKDFWVEIAIAVILLGNRPQSFPFLDFVPLRGIKRTRHRLQFLYRLSRDLGPTGQFFLSP